MVRKIKIKGSAAELTSLEITGNAPNEELTAFQKELKGLSTPSEKALEEKAEAFINRDVYKGQDYRLGIRD